MRKPPKPPASGFGGSKYRNRRVRIDGHSFASAKEGRRYLELKVMLQAGAIQNLRLQVSYPLTVNGVLVCRYVADFVYCDSVEKRDVIEDVKGVRTPVYKLKRKLLLALRGETIREV